MRRLFAPSAVALMVGYGCSLEGLADGDGGVGGAGVTNSGATTGMPASSATSTQSSTSDTSSSSGSASSSGGADEGGGGASQGGGDQGGGGAVASDLFTWAERSGGSEDESTLGDEGRLAMVTLEDGTVVVASVIEEEADDDGDSRDRLSIVGLRAAGGIWTHVFDVSIARHDGGQDATIDLGGIAARSDTFAVALTFRGVLDLEEGAIESTNQDGVALVGTVDADGAVSDLALTWSTGADTQVFQSIAILPDGDLLVGGRFNDELACPGAGAGQGDDRGFVARFEGATCREAVTFGELGASFLGGGVRALALRGDAALAAGSFGGTLVLGGDTYEPSGNTDGVAFALSTAGEGLGLLPVVEVFGGDKADVVSAVVGIEDGFVLSGESQNGDLGARCGTDDLTNRVNAFVARFGADGSCDWLRAWETDASSGHDARALALDDEGAVLVAGAFHTITPCVGGDAWTGAATDGFVFRLDPSTGVPTHGAWLGGSAEQTATAITATGTALGPMVGGSYGFSFDPWLGDPAAIDLFVGALRPMVPLPCQ